MNRNIGQASGDLMTRAVGFLKSPRWSGLVFLFSLVWLIAAIYVCYVNYLSTYYGIVAFFPGLDVLVIWSFVAFVQGSEFVIPFIESTRLHDEMGESWKDSLRATWFVVILIDYVTAVLWFNGKAGITLDNFGSMFSQNLARVVGIEIGSLVFSIIFLVAEVLVVLGFRSVFESGKKLLAIWGVNPVSIASTPSKNFGRDQPSVNQAQHIRPNDRNLPEGIVRGLDGRPFRSVNPVASAEKEQ